MKLLEAASIGRMHLPNRVVMAPLGTGGMGDPDGGYSLRVRDYLVERARGGVGLIISPMTVLDTETEPWVFKPAWLDPVLDDWSKINRLGEIVDEVHHYGTKFCVQLSPGLGRNAQAHAGFAPISASAVPSLWDPSVLCRPITVEEIQRLVKLFGNSVSLARRTGADAIEIHGYGGYLIDQFMSPAWNKRDDEYGGDAERRLRFPIELIEAARANGGPDMALIFKFTVQHSVDGARTLEEGIGLARRLQGLGVDALHLDVGSQDHWYELIPPVYMADAPWAHVAAAVKREVTIPVIAHGKLGRPEVAEAILTAGKADFVCLGRPLLADPAWVKKIREGTPDDIRPCIGCNVCETRIQNGRYISCAVNPECGNEARFRPVPTDEPKSVLVIGGGPAGMEAAIVAASRGHRVTLWERSPQLGGQLRPAGAPSFKQDIRRYRDYLVRQVGRLDIDVQLGCEATRERVAEQAPDAVIVATGGKPRRPPIPGLDRPNVIDAVDVILADTAPQGPVVIVGGGFVGAETALYLAQQGCSVTIVEMMGALIPEPSFDEIAKQYLRTTIPDHGVRLILDARVTQVTDEGVIVDHGGESELVPGATVILALGFTPDAGLANELEGLGAEVRIVGGSAETGMVDVAVWQGFHAARLI